MVSVVGRKRDSVVVTVLCGLALALAFLAILGMFVPFLGTVSLLLSVPAVLIGAFAIGLASLRTTRLVLPVIALLVAVLPAAQCIRESGRR